MLGQDHRLSQAPSALQHFAVMRSTATLSSDVCNTFETTDRVSNDEFTGTPAMISKHNANA